LAFSIITVLGKDDHRSKFDSGFEKKPAVIYKLANIGLVSSIEKARPCSVPVLLVDVITKRECWLFGGTEIIMIHDGVKDVFIDWVNRRWG
jgi:hypothetical protein